MKKEERIGYVREQRKRKRDSGRKREKAEEEERKPKKFSPEPPYPITSLPIKLTPSPDLRFAHRHLRWEASTATYTPDQATRRGSGARRRTAARKAAEEVNSLKTFP